MFALTRVEQHILNFLKSEVFFLNFFSLCFMPEPDSLRPVVMVEKTAVGCKLRLLK